MYIIKNTGAFETVIAKTLFWLWNNISYISMKNYVYMNEVVQLPRMITDKQYNELGKGNIKIINKIIKHD